MSVTVSPAQTPWDYVRDQIEQASQDDTLSADVRLSKLRLFRDDLNDMLGRIDTYIGDLELVREGRDPAFREAVLEAFEDAGIRDLMLERGMASADELDALGYLSREDLRKLDEEGLLEAWVAPRLTPEQLALAEASLGEMINRLWSEASHPRGPHGKFRDVLGRTVKPRGRHGRAMPMPTHAHPVAGASDAAHSQRVGPPAPHEPAHHIDSSPPTAEGVQADIQKVRDEGLNDWPTKGDKATELLGDAADTREAHTVIVRGAGGTRHYTPERKALHDKIIDTLLRERMPVRNSRGEIEMHPNPDGEMLTPTGDTPRVLFMAGGTASGKSTALGLEENQGVTPEAAVHIDPDEIKAMIPEYVQMVQAGDKYAANGVHEESSDISKRLLSEAMKRGLNIVRDGTGNSTQGKFAGQISDMARSGYEPHVFYVNAPTDVAIVRAATRAQRTGRWVPEPEIRNQHRQVSANFVSTVRPLVEDGTIKSISMWHTEDAPVKMAQGGDGSFAVLDEARMLRFEQKANEGTVQ